MGVTATDISYDLDWKLGASSPTINANRSKGDPGSHDPVECGDDSDGDWTKYLATLTAAKTSKAAFVSAFTTAWGSTAASAIGAWTTAEQDDLVKLAARKAARYGV